MRGDGWRPHARKKIVVKTRDVKLCAFIPHRMIPNPQKISEETLDIQWDRKKSRVCDLVARCKADMHYT